MGQPQIIVPQYTEKYGPKFQFIQELANGTKRKQPSRVTSCVII